eukprot:SAG11_NODE_808_length_7088_cov_5.136357_11_plen_102_part_00
MHSSVHDSGPILKKDNTDTRHNKSCTAPMLAELFMKYIVLENGLPLEIVSDRDTRFASATGFWQSFHKALGTSIRLSVCLSVLVLTGHYVTLRLLAHRCLG